MKKREILFWAIAALLIFYFFLAFGVFTFLRQEEGQLFIPTWPRLQDQLRQVGGCCAIAGQAIVQYYRMPMVAVAVHTLLALTLGLSVYRLLQGIRRADYNLPLALFPVFIVLKMSVRASYLVDGTITLALMALAALPLLRWRTGRAIALYGVCATLLLYAIAGPLALCFAPLYALATALLHAGDGRRAQGAAEGTAEKPPQREGRGDGQTGGGPDEGGGRLFDELRGVIVYCRIGHALSVPHIRPDPFDQPVGVLFV